MTLDRRHFGAPTAASWSRSARPTRIPRLRRPPDAAELTGLRRARDAQHPRGLRVRARPRPRRGRAALAAVLAPADRGQEARVHGPRPLQRRPALRAGPGRWGNMVSFIYSIYDTFGSGVTVPG